MVTVTVTVTGLGLGLGLQHLRQLLGEVLVLEVGHVLGAKVHAPRVGGAQVLRELERREQLGEALHAAARVGQGAARDDLGLACCTASDTTHAMD